MGWTFPWASSLGNDFNFDFNVSFTEEQQREGVIEYNYERGGHAMDETQVPEPVAQNAAMTGTDAATYSRDRPGMSAFVLEDDVVYHTYSTYARGTASGVCTNGLTAPPKGATRRPAASGGAATTSTTSAEPSRGCRWCNRGTGDLTTHGFRASFPASLLRRLADLLEQHLRPGRRGAASWRICSRVSTLMSQKTEKLTIRNWITALRKTPKFKVTAPAF